MTTSTKHYLLITLGDDKQVRARVVQAKALTPQLLLFHIETTEWIDHHRHRAEYVSSVGSLPGDFSVVMYHKKGKTWTFKGGLELAQ